MTAELACNSSSVAFVSRPGLADDIAHLSARLDTLAAARATGSRAQAADVDDAVQEILRRVLDGSLPCAIVLASDRELDAAIGRELDRRRHAESRRRKAVARDDASATTGRRVPPLCPSVESQLGASSHALVRAAAAYCAHVPDVLRHAPFRAFVHAYEDGWSVGEVARALRRTPEAVVKVLERAVTKVEDELLRRLRAAGIESAPDGRLPAGGRRLERLRDALEELARRRRPYRPSA